MNQYVELHCHSYFSLLDGASSPTAVVERASELGMGAIALTDHDAVYGAVSFAKAAEQHGIHPIFGAELTLDNGHHLTLLVKDQIGWRNLCYLITQARHNADKGEALLPFSELADHTNGLIALSGCCKGEINAAVLEGGWQAGMDIAKRYKALFADNFWIELQRHYVQGEEDYIHDLVQLAHALDLGYVATNNVHYATHAGHCLQDILVCINHQTTLDEATHLRRPNSEYYLKSPTEMAKLFQNYPKAVENTLAIAEQCQFALDYGLQDLPYFPTPDDLSADDYLRQLCEIALQTHHERVTVAMRRQLRHELNVIRHANLANYFLIVWDIVQFARNNGIRCQGRGSAANSLVAYLLNITPINPLDHHLVFERFLSSERQVAPDIDLDFDANRREEVIQYIYERYGHTHAAMACTLVTFRTRSAIRDVGKALGFPISMLSEAREVIEFGTTENGKTDAVAWQQLTELSQAIKGFPRHLGIHNGGMVVTASPLSHRLPTEPATMQDRIVVQWDKYALEDAGLIKIDILGLRMLSAISEAVEIIAETTGKQIELDTLSLTDPEIYKMICEADTVGVFQVESRAQAQMLPRLQPKNFNDLIIAISLIRPGPIIGNMVHPYLRRRMGVEDVEYAHPRIKNALEETLGVILFQEQVLKVARDLAGFTAGQGELLRRALGHKNAAHEIENLRGAFIKGALANDVPQSIAERVFDQLRAFGSYSFPKSHAASFAVLVYQSAWLKYYYPTAFYIGLLNNQPMGFWQPATLVVDAKRHGVNTLSVDIRASDVKCTVENQAIRLGFNYIKNLGEGGGQRIVEARAERPFKDLIDFCQLTNLPRRVVENLILVGAMEHWNIPRRNLLWEFGKLRYPIIELNLPKRHEMIDLPALSPEEAMYLEYSILGLSPHRHPIEFYRDWLNKNGILNSRTYGNFATGHRVRVAGLMVIRQSPQTAKGHVFLTLEDEDGFMNVVVRPDIYEEYRTVVHRSPLLIVDGELQKQGVVVNVIASKIYTFLRIIKVDEF